MSTQIPNFQTASPPPRPKRFYTSLWVQVSVAIVIAVLFGYLSPDRAIAMKPLGDAFIRMITMIITVMIFCTVVTGIAGMQDLRKVGRVGGKALLYFEIVSTLALAVGFLVGNVVHPGSGFNVDPSTLDTHAVAEYAGQAKAQTVTDFLMHIIPTTIVDAFAKGDILEVVFVSILFGFAMSAAGEHAKPLVTLLESLTKVVFRMVNHRHAIRSDRRIRRHGIHHRQIWPVFSGPAAPADRVVLGDFDSVRVYRIRRSRVAGGIQPAEISVSH